MTITDKYRYIISTLITKTTDGKAVWKSTGASDKYIIYFKNYALIIYSDLMDSARFELLNIDGDSIDSFYAVKGDADYRNAIELYYLARRTALNIDKVIEELLEELSSEDMIG